MDYIQFWHDAKFSKDRKPVEDADRVTKCQINDMIISERLGPLEQSDSSKSGIHVLYVTTKGKGKDVRITGMTIGYADTGIIGKYWGEAYLYEDPGKQGSVKRFKVDSGRVLKFK